MKYKKLSNTDLSVSLICLGTMTYGEQNNEREAHEQLDYSLSKGVNFIDTAEMYAIPPKEETQGRTEEIIPTMRKYLGDNASLLIDANSCYTVDRAIEIGKLLQDNGFSHFEEPCPYWELEQTKAVTDALEIDVTGGEQDCDIPTWRRMIEMGAVNIAQPDILYLGGINRTLRVVDLAKSAGIPITPHCANLSLVTLFTMHLLKAIPNAGKYLEFSIEGADYYPWQQNLFLEDPYSVDDGKVTISDMPGWGIEIRSDWLEKSTYQCSEI